MPTAPSLIDPSTLRGVAGTIIVGAVLAVASVMWQANRDLNRVAAYVTRSEEQQVIDRLGRAEGRLSEMEQRYVEIGEIIQDLPSRKESDLQTENLTEGISTLTDRLQRFEARVDKRFDDLEDRIEDGS